MDRDDTPHLLAALSRSTNPADSRDDQRNRSAIQGWPVLRQRDIMWFAGQAIRHRRWPVACAALVLLAPLAIGLHAASVPFRAAIKIFVSGGASSPLGNISSLLGAGAPGDRDALILSQEALLYSQLMFNRVAAKTPDRPRELSWSQDVRDGLRPLKAFLFGEAYVSALENYIDWKFVKYKESLRFDAQLDAGSFTIEVKDADALGALERARLVAGELIALHSEMSANRSKAMTEVLSHRLDQTRVELEASSQRIVEFAAKNKFPNSSDYVRIRLQEHLSALSRAADARARLDGAKAAVANLLGSIKEVESALKQAISGDGAGKVDSLLLELAKTEQSIAQQSRRSTQAAANEALADRAASLRKALDSVTDGFRVEDFIGAAGLKTILEDLRAKVSSLQSEVASAEIYAARLGKNLDVSQGELDEFPRLQGEMSRMLIEHQQVAEVMSVILETYYTALFQNGSITSQMSVIDEPSLVYSAMTSKSRLFLAILIFAIGSALLGVALFDFFRRTILSREQLTEVPTTKFIGSIAWLDRRSREGLGAAAQFEESINAAGFLLMRHAGNEPTSPMLVSVTSASSGVGKSTATILLAMNLRRRGVDIAVVDADVRASSRSVSDLAAKAGQPIVRIPVRLDDDDFVVPSPVPNALSVYCLEAPPGQAQELNQAAIDRIKAITRLHKLVLCDLPPLYFADSHQVLSLSSRVVLCTRERVSTEREVFESVRTIEQITGAKNETLLALLQEHSKQSQIASNYRYRPPTRTDKWAA